MQLQIPEIQKRKNYNRENTKVNEQKKKKKIRAGVLESRKVFFANKKKKKRYEKTVDVFSRIIKIKVET